MKNKGENSEKHIERAQRIKSQYAKKHTQKTTTSVKSTDVIGAKHERWITPVGSRIMLLCFVRFLRYQNERESPSPSKTSVNETQRVQCNEQCVANRSTLPLWRLLAWFSSARAVMSGNYTTYTFCNWIWIATMNGEAVSHKTLRRLFSSNSLQNAAKRWSRISTTFPDDFGFELNGQTIGEPIASNSIRRVANRVSSGFWTKRPIKCNRFLYWLFGESNGLNISRWILMVCVFSRIFSL